MPPSRPEFDDWISASSVGDHVFCARSFWLREVQGHRVGTDTDARRQRGTDAHATQERQRRVLIRTEWVGPTLIGGGALFLAALILFSFLGS